MVRICLTIVLVFLLGIPVSATSSDEPVQTWDSLKRLEGVIRENERAFASTGLDVSQLRSGRSCGAFSQRSYRVTVGYGVQGSFDSAIGIVGDMLFLYTSGQIQAANRNATIFIRQRFSVRAQPWQDMMGYYRELCTNDLEGAYASFRDAANVSQAQRVAGHLFAQTGKKIWDCRSQKPTLKEARECKE